MKNIDSAVSYDSTAIIKAFAILLMVFHHCFGFPSRYVYPPDYMLNQHLIALAQAAKICVPVFAFLSGWTYYHHADKSIGYSIKKITTFLTDYWIVVILISLFAFFFCNYKYSVDLLGELLPVFPHPLMLHSWYVWFYILIMIILLPILGLIDRKSNNIWQYTYLLIFLLVFLLIMKKTPYMSTLYAWSPPALIGFFTAKLRILELCISTIKSIPRIFVFSFISFIASLLLAWYTDTQCSILWLGKFIRCFVSTPSFVMAVLSLSFLCNNKIIWHILRHIGNHSMNIWFIHCIFHSEITRTVVQKVFFFWSNPIWIFCIVVIISLAFSIIITPVQQYLNRKVLPYLFNAINQ